MRLWATHPELEESWLDRAAKAVAVALVVSGGMTLAILQYFGAVFFFKGRNEGRLARQGIVQGGDALNEAVLPALWLTLAVLAAEILVITLLVRRRRRRRGVG
ncbi:MAG: hypothetical protein ABR540_12105 [Acidimicrobiales bacterium]